MPSDGCNKTVLRKHNSKRCAELLREHQKSASRLSCSSWTRRQVSILPQASPSYQNSSATPVLLASSVFCCWCSGLSQSFPLLLSTTPPLSSFFSLCLSPFVRCHPPLGLADAGSMSGIFNWKYHENCYRLSFTRAWGLMMGDSLRRVKFNISPRLTRAVGSRNQGPRWNVRNEVQSDRKEGVLNNPKFL